MARQQNLTPARKSSPAFVSDDHKTIVAALASLGASQDPAQAADVTVDTTRGEFLHYRVTVEGGNPKFVFSCIDRNNIFEAKDFPGHPKQTYEWDFLRHPGDVDRRPLDTFTITMLFIAARKYLVEVFHRQADGNSVLVRDRTFESDDPETIRFTTVVANIL